ncbi:PP2C family protein-serine/threonine phosphatase [Actinacidiphila oryziradicis]|uniref:protein-serine/threonine phosphatase n=1 Tax=Actinacidiphila oryziradicis TaxID=2571141 RepID=A0A4V5N0U6_9ACTN|nr:GAF domain-containing SpoIIE family protein phosphatase [Actinacidiphila oryziradicis]TKA03159.1 GAF domain-containing protein [Actinacidiphila oryziradicis]
MDEAIPLRLLADVTNALKAGRGWEGILQRLAELLVERLADWCVIDLLDEEGGARRAVVAGRGSGPDSPRPGESSQLLPAWPQDSAAPLAQALRRGAAVLIPDVPSPEQAADPLERAQLELLARLEADTAIAAPLDVSGRPFGVIIVARTRARRPFTEAQVPLIESIAHQGALVVDNARLYGQQRDIATHLQRSLLPDTLPDVPPFRLVARYAPARTYAEVGGDWYDAIVLPDGTLAFTVGDVVGHDVRATARMSQLRHMLRALVLDRAGPPDEVVRRLDQALENLHEADVTATLILGMAHPSTSAAPSLTWANAGHPPPLLIPAHAQPRFLAGGHGLPLGVDVGVPREAAATAPLTAGSMFLLYTDGLIERRGEDLSTGMERLRRAAARLHGLAPARLLDELVEHVVPARDDDVALLALCHAGGSPG